MTKDEQEPIEDFFVKIKRFSIRKTENTENNRISTNRINRELDKFKFEL